ncbi:hypothetical protein NSK11_contig00156-0016 [Nocardia seriolae]|uniref:Alpha/beta hydrolase n=1 Tax=Nocardia seriolae TaxID=37332 RepID=A0ABC9Z4G2_9NOCA|nr:hypothetical protein NS07_v2contig00152-0016 [Nocardia seriolae]GAP32403.1 hypothetical protein NSK11_contig00156-0016 [Nocardia seriolae]
MSAVVVAALCAACGSGSGSGSGSKDPAAQPITWAECPQELGAQVQCAAIEVPVDWGNPDGEKITVGIDRLPASDPDHRIGALVLNPGGPGGSGTDLISGVAKFPALVSAELRSRFDLIGLDPRGIGTSRPAVKCDTELQRKVPDIFPADQAAFDAMVAANKAFGESCKRRTGALIDHMDTVAVARDLEVVRQRLGGQPLNYLGLSYGTEIGFEYARLYPNSSRVLALDGALVHSLAPSSMHMYEAAAYQDTLRQFADWCRASADCALGGDDAAVVVRELAAKARQSPLPAPGCASSGRCESEVRMGDLLTQVQNGLLLQPAEAVGPGWAGLASALNEARHGDASKLSPQLPSDEDAAGLAVGCAEFRADFDSYPLFKTEQTLGETVAPDVFGSSQSFTYIARCLGWPAAFSNPPHTATVTPTVAPLIVNATHDPSTSYGWAQLMATQIPNAVLLTRAGNGHTSFFIPGRTRDTITDYLINGTLPAPGTILPS